MVVHKAVIFEVRCCLMPKCTASQVTVSPSFITPEVTPAIGRSSVYATERRCTSTLSDRSKHRSGEASMDVSSRMIGIALILSLLGTSLWLESSVTCREKVPLEMIVEVLEQLVAQPGRIAGRDLWFPTGPARAGAECVLNA